MYADIADQASHHEELELQACLAAHRRQAGQRKLIPTGSCYYCTSGVPPGHLFCDSSCRDDYEKEVAAELRNHGPRPQH